MPLKFAIEWGGNGRNDFAYFYDAAQAALWGSPGIWFPYPPHALFLYLPFAFLPFLAAWAAFNVLGLILFLLAARPYLKGLPAILAVCTPASLFCLLYGQTGLVVGALWLWAFSGRWQAVALLTFKPHLGVLSALSLRRETILPTVGLAAALLLASWIAFPEWWPQFFRQAFDQSLAIGVNTKWPYIGVGPAIGYGFVGWAVFAGAAVYLLSIRIDAFTCATAALLVSPYAFHYDMPAASLGFALALQREEKPVRTLAFTLALLCPVLVRFGAWIAPPLLLWALWCQTKRTPPSASACL